MKVAELLPVKKITAVRRTRVALSVTSAGHFWRARMGITTKDFEFLYSGLGAVAPRSEIHGNGEQGLIVKITANQGVKVNQSSKSSVGLNFSCRELGCTENRVPVAHVDAVLVEYEGSDRYLLTEPLPDQFLTTTVRARRARDGVPPLRASQIAFDTAGGPLPDSMKPRTPPVEAKKTAPPPPPKPTSVEPVLIQGTAQGGDEGRPRSLDDLKELVSMLNEQMRKHKDEGINVILRVDEDGTVRAQVPVTVYQDL